jgi:hypothetical protein
LIQTVESNVQRNQRSAEEADQPVDTSTGGLLREALRLRITRPPRTALQAPPEDVQSAVAAAYKQRCVREFQQKLQEHRDNTAKGVYIPQINKAEMKKIKVGLTDLFKMDLIPMLKEFQPCLGDFDEWLAFERADEECLDRIRIHILKSLDRGTRTLYGTRKINGKLLEQWRKGKKMHSQTNKSTGS